MTDVTWTVFLLRRFAVTLALASVSACAQQPTIAPYAGQQQREIKVLTEQEVKDLLDGSGLGLAKAAELNRYPGPAHVLEHAAALQLSAVQREGVAAIMERHKAEARSLGARVVELERELDTLFARRMADAASVDRVLSAIGETNARLRGSHLKAHLETTALLTAAQVDHYDRLRGYSGASAGQPGAHRRHH
jgi:hypothetical protein